MMRACSLVVAAFTAIGIISIPVKAGAQELVLRHAFAGPAIDTNSWGLAGWSAGGGIERWVGHATNIGGDCEYLFHPASERHVGGCCISSEPAYSLLLLSVNGSHYFARSKSAATWQPFVIGGIGIVATTGAWGPLLNAGGGADRWITPHVGLGLFVLERLTNQFLLALWVVFVFVLK
jgi:hypothetical protein